MSLSYKLQSGNSTATSSFPRVRAHVIVICAGDMYKIVEKMSKRRITRVNRRVHEVPCRSCDPFYDNARIKCTASATKSAIRSTDISGKKWR